MGFWEDCKDGKMFLHGSKSQAPPLQGDKKGTNMKILELVGIDSWYRPVYRDQYGQLWKDINLGQLMPNLYSATGNEFEGEPDFPIVDGFIINEGDYILDDERRG